MSIEDTNIVNLADARDKKDGPHPKHVFLDPNGVKWFEFTCAYRDGDQEFGFSLWALDFADADRRMALLKANGRVDGQLYSETPQ